MIYAFAGHRPDRLGGYGAEAWASLCGFAIKTVKKYRPEKAVLGMAQGWDMAVAAACVVEQVPFIAAVPFRGQEKIWPHHVQKLYRQLLGQSEEMHVLFGGKYEAWKMHKRNEWMVRRGDELIALWDGTSTSGTFKAVEYAKNRGVIVHNLWSDWLQHNA